MRSDEQSESGQAQVLHSSTHGGDGESTDEVSISGSSVKVSSFIIHYYKIFAPINGYYIVEKV